MNDTPPEMVRVTHAEMGQAWINTWAHVFALDFAVRAMLALHPDKGRLIKVWDELLPERIDEWMAMSEYQNPGFRDRLHGVLANLRGFLGDAAEVDQDGGDDDD